jgi:hypothetical protein
VISGVKTPRLRRKASRDPAYVWFSKPKGAEFAIQVRALKTQRLGGVGNAVVVPGDNSGNVLALGPSPGLAKRRPKRGVKERGGVDNLGGMGRTRRVVSMAIAGHADDLGRREAFVDGHGEYRTSLCDLQDEVAPVSLVKIYRRVTSRAADWLSHGKRRFYRGNRLCQTGNSAWGARYRHPSGPRLSPGRRCAPE